MTKLKHILLVDDDKDLLESLKRSLVQRQYAVTTIMKLQEAKKALQGSTKFDLVLLDIYLDDGDGIAFLNSLQNSNDPLPPIILMTGSPDQASEVAGLEFGADDYVSKPIDIMTLLARIKAVLRREGRQAKPSQDHMYAFEGWKLDARIQTLYSPEGMKVDLTPGLYHLLMAFITHANSIVSREKLYELAYSGADEFNERAIDIQISRLRRVFVDLPGLIKTVRGSGYIFLAEVQELN